MANGTTNADPTLVELTPMRVSWGGSDLGGTSTGCSVSIKTSKVEVMEDQYGKTPLDHRFNGQNITVTTEFAEARNFDQWAAAFPSADLATSGQDSAVTFQLPIGGAALDLAKQLVLHPLVLADNDTSQDHTFFVACPLEVSDVHYGPDKQTGIKVVWQCYPQLTGTGAPKIYVYGKASIGP